MNNGESLSSTGGGSLSQTGNPQTIPTQNLGAPQSNLQSGSVKSVYEEGIKITSVGSSQFTPVDEVKTSTAYTESSPQTTPTSMTPIIIGFVLVVIVLAGLIILAVKKSQPQKLDEVRSDPVRVKSKSKKSRSKRKNKKFK
jgi:hypothetical protein